MELLLIFGIIVIASTTIGIAVNNVVNAALKEYHHDHA